MTYMWTVSTSGAGHTHRTFMRHGKVRKHQAAPESKGRSSGFGWPPGWILRNETWQNGSQPPMAGDSNNNGSSPNRRSLFFQHPED